MRCVIWWREWERSNESWAACVVTWLLWLLWLVWLFSFPPFRVVASFQLPRFARTGRRDDDDDENDEGKVEKGVGEVERRPVGDDAAEDGDVAPLKLAL